MDVRQRTHPPRRWLDRWPDRWPRFAAAFSALAGVSVALAGCANPGVPRPPSLHLPSPATGLMAERVGARVTLHWTTPAKTTDDGPIRGPITAVICREVAPAGAAGRAVAPGVGSPTKPAARGAVGCHELMRQPAVPGPGSAMDTLPPELERDPPRLLLYRVELFNRAGRSAKPSGPAFAASGVAPAPMGSLRVTAVRQGARVEWPPVAGPGFPELARTLEATAAGPGGAAGQKSGSASAAGAGGGHGFASGTRAGQGGGRGSAPAGPVVLRPEGFAAEQPGTAANSASNSASSPAADVGGLLDPGVHSGDTVTYTAARVRLLSLGGHMLGIRGEPSAPVRFTDQDVFPPRTPVRLTAIAEPPLGGNPAEIDLSWTNAGAADPDLRGYNVYRSVGVGQPFKRLNAETVEGPAYRDLDVKAGAGYTYRVTAVDESGNESRPSAEVRETMPRTP